MKMEDFKELLEKRYSVRTYLSKRIEEEKIEYILECARLAPSACNHQPWEFYVITSEEGRKAVQSAYPREWFTLAPVYIVICGDHNQSWKRPEDKKDYCDVDIAIAAEHICLAAESIGLGTCWVCNYNPDILNRFLNLSDNIEAVAIFPIGYIDEEKAKIPEKKRKPLNEIVKWM
ncbi:MAG: nitroreductase family protein [Dysgonomonas sp.]